MKIYGSWGFFYGKIPNDLAVRALSADASVSRADYFDLDLTQPVPDGVLALDTTSHFLQQGVAATTIDPSVKSTTSTRCAGRIEYESAPAELGFRYIHRDIPRVIEDVHRPIVAPISDPGAQSVDYTLTNPSRAPRRGGLGAPSRRLFIATTPSSLPPTIASPSAGRSRRHTGTPGSAARSRGSTAMTTGSPTRGSRHSSISRRTTRATRPSACRSSGTAVASASSARSARGRCRSIGRTRSSCSGATACECP